MPHYLVPAIMFLPGNLCSALSKTKAWKIHRYSKSDFLRIRCSVLCFSTIWNGQVYSRHRGKPDWKRSGEGGANAVFLRLGLVGNDGLLPKFRQTEPLRTEREENRKAMVGQVCIRKHSTCSGESRLWITHSSVTWSKPLQSVILIFLFCLQNGLRTYSMIRRSVRETI